MMESFLWMVMFWFLFFTKMQIERLNQRCRPRCFCKLLLGDERDSTLNTAHSSWPFTIGQATSHVFLGCVNSALICKALEPGRSRDAPYRDHTRWCPIHTTCILVRLPFAKLQKSKDRIGCAAGGNMCDPRTKLEFDRCTVATRAFVLTSFQRIEERCSFFTKNVSSGRSTRVRPKLDLLRIQSERSMIGNVLSREFNLFFCLLFYLRTKRNLFGGFIKRGQGWRSSDIIEI